MRGGSGEVLKAQSCFFSVFFQCFLVFNGILFFLNIAYTFCWGLGLHFFSRLVSSRFASSAHFFEFYFFSLRTLPVEMKSIVLPTDRFLARFNPETFQCCLRAGLM